MLRCGRVAARPLHWRLECVQVRVRCFGRMQPGPQLKTATTESFKGADTPAARTDNPAARTDNPAARTDNPAARTDNPAARTDPLPGHGRPSRVRSGGAARSSTRRFRPPALDCCVLHGVCCMLHAARCTRHAARCMPGGRWTPLRRRCCRCWRHLLGQQPQLQPHRQPVGVRERVHLQRALHQVLARLEQLAPRERHELRHAVPVWCGA
jgi:hypothetical protein